jgi:A/G-specific adenine glycosylase
VLDRCAWQQAGRPAYDGPARRRQLFAGTDRQVRGRLMAVLRSASEPVAPGDLAGVWPDAEQRDRALAGLLADGLVEGVGASFQLPGVRR